MKSIAGINETFSCKQIIFQDQSGLRQRTTILLAAMDSHQMMEYKYLQISLSGVRDLRVGQSHQFIQ
jgi:hypothetical protein